MVPFLHGTMPERLHRQLRRRGVTVHTLNTVAQILGLVSFVGFIWLVVLAFKRSVGWGVGVLFLSPIAAAFFARKYWDEVKLSFGVYASTLLASTAIVLYLFTAWGGWNFVTTVVTTISRSAAQQRPITEEEDLEVKHSLLVLLENATESEENRQTIAAMKQFLEGKGGSTKEEQIEIVYDFSSLMREYGFDVDPKEWLQAGQIRRAPPTRERRNGREDMRASIQEKTAASGRSQETDSGTPPGTRNPRPKGPQSRLISFAEAKSYIGAHVILTGRNGLEQEGTLIDVSGTMLRFETYMSGGRMSFEFKKEQIESLKVLFD
jgi:hypothetical protein